MENHHHKNYETTDLFDAIVRLKSHDEAEKFFKDLCTPQELHALRERWRVCQLLETKELSYREIHAITGASLTTIGRVARFLNEEPHQGYRSMLRKIKDKDKEKQ